MKDDKPWWTDSRQVGEAVGTLIVLTMVVCFCMVLVIGTGKWVASW